METGYTLVREHDNLTVGSADIRWIEFNDDKTFKKAFKTIKIGRSLFMSPFNAFFTWATTPVTEIISQEKFKTKNSTYTLTKTCPKEINS